jgi:cysteine desulfurase
MNIPARPSHDGESTMTLYLDCNATTPVDPRVLAEIVRCFSEEYGNAGSQHEFGRRAKRLVHVARDRVGHVVHAKRNEILFTSGATESNNLAILGLAEHASTLGKRHVVSTQIEHKAVLEPLAVLRSRGFDVTLVPPERDGRVAVGSLMAALRPETVLVSLMHVNNETGVIQPVAELAEQLVGRDLFFHVDAAQGFGKDLDALRHPRIDLISISSHKISGPAGVGALMARRRRNRVIPLTALCFGGGQELGLRPGTLPVALISGFGLAAELAEQESVQRRNICRQLREVILSRLSVLHPVLHTDLELALPHVVNLSFPGLDGEDVIELLEGAAAVATGSACTSVCATASHVLSAMSIDPPDLDGAIRLSWSHTTDHTQLGIQLGHMVDRLAKRMKSCSNSH